MKLKNKKTGEIGNLVLNINPNRESYSVLSTENGDTICGNLVLADYDSLAELNEEWEDYKEPKDGWCIDYYDAVKVSPKYDALIKEAKLIGNYFETKEEAEKAVEKLRAWKRLKDKGFKFIDHIDRDSGQGMTRYEWDGYVNGEDLDLLFGGEE